MPTTEARAVDPILWSDFTPREQDVAAMLLRGLTLKEAARELGMAVGTVRVHTSHIFRKVNVHNGRQLLIKMYHLEMPRLRHRKNDVEVSREMQAAE